MTAGEPVTQPIPREIATLPEPRHFWKKGQG